MTNKDITPLSDFKPIKYDIEEEYNIYNVVIDGEIIYNTMNYDKAINIAANHKNAIVLDSNKKVLYPIISYDEKNIDNIGVEEDDNKSSSKFIYIRNKILSLFSKLK